MSLGVQKEVSVRVDETGTCHKRCSIRGSSHSYRIQARAEGQSSCLLARHGASTGPDGNGNARGPRVAWYWGRGPAGSPCSSSAALLRGVLWTPARRLITGGRLAQPLWPCGSRERGETRSGAIVAAVVNGLGHVVCERHCMTATLTCAFSMECPRAQGPGVGSPWGCWLQQPLPN